MPKSRTLRKCLRCGGEFKSEGNWNRVCAPCFHRRTHEDRTVSRVELYVEDLRRTRRRRISKVHGG